MESKEILAKIEKIKLEIEADACDLIRAKIQQRDLNLQKSGRGFFLAPIINALRRRLLVEMNHILEPLLENQKEINLRLLKEIEKIKQSHEPLSKTDPQAGQDKR
jgi:single-stranded DNA-specific DHH superfamily exonuclease